MTRAGCRALIPGLVFSLLTAAPALLAQSSVLVVDAFNKKVHVAGNAQTKRPVGGLAKIATAMVTPARLLRLSISMQSSEGGATPVLQSFNVGWRCPAR